MLIEHIQTVVDTKINALPRRNSLEQLRYEVGITSTCFGLEIQPVCFAPYGEVLRVNVHADDPNPEALLTFAKTLSGGEPCFVGPTEFITVLKQ